jgi:hypothetical protein
LFDEQFERRFTGILHYRRGQRLPGLHDSSKVATFISNRHAPHTQQQHAPVFVQPLRAFVLRKLAANRRVEKPIKSRSVEGRQQSRQRLPDDLAGAVTIQRLRPAAPRLNDSVERKAKKSIFAGRQNRSEQMLGLHTLRHG